MLRWCKEIVRIRPLVEHVFACGAPGHRTCVRTPPCSRTVRRLARRTVRYGTACTSSTVPEHLRSVQRALVRCTSSTMIGPGDPSVRAGRGSPVRRYLPRVEKSPTRSAHPLSAPPMARSRMDTGLRRQYSRAPRGVNTPLVSENSPTYSSTAPAAQRRGRASRFQRPVLNAWKRHMGL